MLTFVLSLAVVVGLLAIPATRKILLILTVLSGLGFVAFAAALAYNPTPHTQQITGHTDTSDAAKVALLKSELALARTKGAEALYLAITTNDPAEREKYTNRANEAREYERKIVAALEALGVTDS